MAAEKMMQFFADELMVFAGEGMIVEVGIERLEENRLKSIEAAFGTDHGKPLLLSIIADNLADVYDWDLRNVYGGIPYCVEVIFMQYDHRIMGRVIRQQRENRRMTQEVFSGFAALTRSHLAMIERGQKRPNVDTLWKIAEAFEMPLSELFRLAEEEMNKDA